MAGGDVYGDAGLRAWIEIVRATIREACERSRRAEESVRLVAVTKTVAPPVIEAARRLGLSDFGENRAKELAGKARLLPATWHYLGRLQRGTAALVAEHADVAHSAEPGTGLAHVARRAAAAGRRLPCLVEVDFTEHRQGVKPGELGAFLDGTTHLEGARITGLMTVPPFSEDPEAARPFFRRLRELRDALRERHPGLVELSMGMSADYAIAVEEGATMVRVGTALFGARPAARDREAPT